MEVYFLRRGPLCGGVHSKEGPVVLCGGVRSEEVPVVKRGPL